MLSLSAQELNSFSFRVINPMEVSNLTDDALEYLLSIKSECAITEEQFEAILVDVASIFGILDLDCLKDLLDYRGIEVTKTIN